MKDQLLSMNLRPLLLAGVVLTLAACGGESGNGAGQRTDGPAFNANAGAETRSPMAEMGYQLALLERELTADEYNAIEQQEVVAILEQMELIGSSFQAEQAGESHLFLQEDMTTFLDSLTRARMAAEESLPRYFLAGKVAGGCANCHGVSL